MCRRSGPSTRTTAGFRRRLPPGSPSGCWMRTAMGSTHPADRHGRQERMDVVPARGCAAGWGHAQLHRWETIRAAHQLDPMLVHINPNTDRQARELSGDAGDGSARNLKAVHRVRGCRRAQARTQDARPRDEDPPGTRRTSQALSAANARGHTWVWPEHTGSWRPGMLATRGRSLVSGVWSAAPTPC